MNFTGSTRIKFAAKAIENFGIFLARDHGFTEKEALKEVELVKAEMDNSGLIYKPEDLSRKDFLTYSRVGGTKSMDRMERAAMYSTFQNAINHASAVA